MLRSNFSGAKIISEPAGYLWDGLPVIAVAIASIFNDEYQPLRMNICDILKQKWYKEVEEYKTCR
jgi:hypothetical protein